MQALPAVAEQDLERFGHAISELQCLVGDHFGPAQGGGRYASRDVADAMDWLAAHGVCCEKVTESYEGLSRLSIIKLAFPICNRDIPVHYRLPYYLNCLRSACTSRYLLLIGIFT